MQGTMMTPPGRERAKPVMLERSMVLTLVMGWDVPYPLLPVCRLILHAQWARQRQGEGCIQSYPRQTLMKKMDLGTAVAPR